MHIELKEKNVRQRMEYLSQKLNSGQSATIQAFGLGVSTAVYIACTLRSRLGDVHQVTKIIEEKIPTRKIEIGIRIVLSLTAFDTSNVGY